MIRAALRMLKQWRARRATRQILAQLSDNQLRDIGLTRHDVKCKR
ncbi:hypothetical protein CRX72_26450 [Pantoea sp. BRM17]|nr:hypothetical protein CRX72_26450 [Pantoea sp. BRM17]